MGKSLVDKPILTDDEAEKIKEYLKLRLEKGLDHGKAISEMAKDRAAKMGSDTPILVSTFVEQEIDRILMKIMKAYFEKMAVNPLQRET